MQSCLQYRRNTAVVVMLRQGRIAAMKWNCISSARRKRLFTVFYKLKFITMYAGLLREYRVHRNSSKCTCIEVYCTTQSKTDKPLYNQLPGLLLGAFQFPYSKVQNWQINSVCSLRQIQAFRYRRMRHRVRPNTKTNNCTAVYKQIVH